MVATERPRHLAYAALAILFLISLTYRLRDTADRVDEMRHGAAFARLPFDVDLPQLAITGTRPESDQAGLRTGDLIVGVEGGPLRGARDLYVPLRNARPGQHLIVQVESPTPTGSDRRTASIELRPMRPGPPTASDWFSFAIGSLAMPYLCLALGFWVAAVRIRDKQAWLLLVLLLSLAEFAGSSWRTLFGRGDALQPLAVTYQLLFANLWPISMMLFGIYFPDRLGIDRRFPWAKWIVIAPIAIPVFGAIVAVDLLVLQHAAAALAIEGLLGSARVLVEFLDLAAVIIFFVAMSYKTATASNPDARRRLLLLDVGAAASIAPLLIVILLQVGGLARFPDWIFLPLFGALFLLPVTMAYVIVVHRAMDVRVVIRQGLQYVLARGAIRTVQIVLLVAVSVAAAPLLSGSAGIARVAAVVAGLAAIAAIGRRFADRLRGWVDRRFFREAYETDAILSDLAAKVRTMVETGPLLETVATRIAESLHVPRIAILLEDAGAFQPAFTLGFPAAPDVSIPLQGATARRLRGQQHALVRLDDESSWVQQADDRERTSLQQLKSKLLLPLSINEKLLGILSLGDKQSEEPFSSTDIRLLDTVAAQTGLALENGRLMAAVAAEVANREKTKRELEIAREVQERLFPQEYPPIEGIDYAGACRPALGVGGDYYDFIRISDSELGLAIGDVSGKGIPAALLMATLRAYVRGQTIRGESDLAAMMATLNELVYESSAPNRYATFFYGHYDAATRQLHYVNGGHNPPMIFRQADAEVVRLGAGGPVIGLMQGFGYQQACAALAPGDVLVAFTDGISEAMNALDEEWGEERLIEAVRPNTTLDARELIDTVMQAADAFVAGAPQHDDMTMVVVRLV